MIYLLATQGIGVEWGGRRGISPQDYRVLSNPMHVRGHHPEVERDRVIEVGPGPSSPDVRRAIELSFSADWIEWEPMIPADPSELAPPNPKKVIVFDEYNDLEANKRFMACLQQFQVTKAKSFGVIGGDL
jgi:hypothetical protein